jgi:hypothetical protein
MPFFNGLEDRNFAFLSMGSQIHKFHSIYFSYTIEISLSIAWVEEQK